jgi:hypothetical protein
VSTSIKTQGRNNEVNFSQTSYDINDGPVQYRVTDFSQGISATHDGCDIVRRESGKPSEVVFCYPYLNPTTNTTLTIGKETVEVTFIPKP